MSFDDYANHIYQKHRLAIALAIIRSKPANVKTDKYLEDLKSKIDHKMDDDAFSVFTDDFLMGDDDAMNDSVTILKDFEPEFVENDNNLSGDGDDNVARKKPSEIINRNLPENLSQITYYDSSQTVFPGKITDIILSQDNHNINQKSNIEITLTNNFGSEGFNDRIRNIDQNTIEKKSINETYSKEYNEKVGSNYKTVPITNECIDETYYDSQKTQLYTVHGFTQDCTHFSPSQNDIITPNKYLYGINKTRNVSTVPNKDINEENNTSTVNINDFDNETLFVSEINSSNIKIVEKPTNTENEEYIQTMNMYSRNNDDNFDEIQYDKTNFNRDSNKTMNDINKTQFSQNVDEIQIIEQNVVRNSFPKSQFSQNSEVVNMEITNESFQFSQNIDYNLTQSKEIDNTKTKFEKAVDTSKARNESNQENLSQNSEKHYQLSTTVSGNDSSGQNKNGKEEDYETEEIISYKVLEEFNKVKSFLKRQNRRISCDGYSTDSGYRSDSQRSSNRSALQLSGNWLNQSGFCLFTYIMQCPLVAGTRDITNEIAQVLSQLIDRLHEDEKYPSFIEDLLETVDILLRHVYEGESSEDSQFLKKDENIQRILLLNKSIHVQKYCIEKISNILETFHSNVTATNSTYELSNIDQIENITYIFHILEIILKNYLKNIEILSQCSTQNSQDDEKVLKKSSLTDIWRKKWNPSQQVFEGSREKKCILKNCSEILNRIVVDCVSSYSLIAYSALKCFNSMQT